MEETEEVHENVFASPWKDSDLILVVENTEFHVHRANLAMQSPVFKAMLNGQFKEAVQEKITLQGKNPEDMLQFLKFFYPPNMIKRPLISLTDENAVKMLVLADEYQAEDVLNYCLEAATITSENVLRVLPYAVKYNHPVHGKCFGVFGNTPIDEVDDDLPKVDSELLKKLLIEKCRYLESIAMKARRSLDILLEQEDNSALSEMQVSYLQKSRRCKKCVKCESFVYAHKFGLARKCAHCLNVYIKEFINQALKSGSWTRRGKDDLLSVLKDTDDLFKGEH